MKATSFISISPARNPARLARRLSRGAFTLVELLVIITIIALLASLTLFAMWGAQESAKEAKTRSLIVRLNDVILPMYESYKGRSVPVIPTSVLAPRLKAKLRIDALRELQRLELPDRWSDIGQLNASGIPVLSNIVSGVTRPGVSLSYFRRFEAAVAKAKLIDPTNFSEIVYSNQQAETLYLIVSTFSEDGLEFFRSSDYADTDGDGAPEFLDGWGQPIQWFRWPVGFDSPVTRTTVSSVTSPPGPDPNNSNLLTIQGDSNLSDVSDSYVGYVLRFTTGDARGQLAYVTDYDGPTRTFHVFGGPTPIVGNRFSVLAPDPFDSHKVYPPRAGDPWGNSSNSSYQPQFTFETQPLIYSAGPDEIFDIVGSIEVSSGVSFRYENYNNNPFFLKVENSARSSPLAPLDLVVQMGTPRNVEDDGDGEPGDVPTEHLDNITSHDLTRR